MKNYLFILFATLFFSSTAMADMIPPRPKPPTVILAAAGTLPVRTGYVTDLAGKLSQQDRNILQQRLRQFQNSSGKTIAVALLPNLGGESVEDVGYKVANGWGIGKKDADTGVLLLISFAERKSRIEVGKGLEGDLTDSKSSMILRNTLAPHMKKGDVYGGITAALEEIANTISPGHGLPVIAAQKSRVQHQHSTSAPAPAMSSQDAEVLGLVGLVFLLIAVVVGAVVWLWNSIRDMFGSKKRYQEELDDIKYRPVRVNPPIRNRRIIAPIPPIPPLEPLPPLPPLEPLVPLAPISVAAAMTIPRTPNAKSVMADREARLAAAERAAREEEEARQARRRREREEEERREERNRSSYSSSSYGSSSSSFDSGSSGGFDGGSFGGGGASGDW